MFLEGRLSIKKCAKPLIVLVALSTGLWCFFQFSTLQKAKTSFTDYIALSPSTHLIKSTQPNTLSVQEKTHTKIVTPSKVSKSQSKKILETKHHSTIKKDNPYERDIGYVPTERLIHFDLKGAPPKISYLIQVMELSKSAGATGILIEYEDMFPYQKDLEVIRAPNAYSLDDIHLIIDTANQLNMTVIPLVQTFGHMEFVLKGEKFRHLREADPHPQALCPSKNESFDLVMELIDQIVEAHPNITQVHIGCDEVFHLGECPLCSEGDSTNLYLDHVTRVASYVVEQHSLQPIIWDDMLHKIPEARIKKSGLGRVSDVMSWTYITDIYYLISRNVFRVFSRQFDNLWGASAFKGAFGDHRMEAEISSHFLNNLNWIAALKEQSKSFRTVKGLVLTGWQRYDHFASLCELLPAGLPSLILNLLVVSNGGYNASIVQKQFDELMQCSDHRVKIDMENDKFFRRKGASCRFPGSKFFRLLPDHANLRKDVDKYLEKVKWDFAWLTGYNVRTNGSNFDRMKEINQVDELYRDVEQHVYRVRDALQPLFDDLTVGEWIETNIYWTMLAPLEQIQSSIKTVKSTRTWTPRSNDILPQLEKYGISAPKRRRSK